jgi:hypothetical protein
MVNPIPVPVMQAGEPLPAFGVRVLMFALTCRVLDDLSLEALDLGCHAAINLHTEHNTGALNAAVIRMRREANTRRRWMRERLEAAGCTFEPVNKPESAAPASSGGLTAAEVEFVRTMIREFGNGQNGGDDDSGHKVKTRRPKPTQPPAGCAAPF